MRRILHTVSTCLMLGAFAHPCAAQGAFTGSWDVVAQDEAPWVAARKEPKPQPEPHLLKSQLVFAADKVVAPGWMGCKKAKYQVSDFSFDSLFEGGLSDPEHGLKDPKKLALKMGFTKEPVPTMVNSCSELLFHMQDANTLVFALNNMVYTLKRHPSSP